MAHPIPAVSAKAASGHGALDGFAVNCACGERASFSLRTLADQHAADHHRFMERRGR